MKTNGTLFSLLLFYCILVYDFTILVIMVKIRNINPAGVVPVDVKHQSQLLVYGTLIFPAINLSSPVYTTLYRRVILSSALNGLFFSDLFS
jgi:hypothetical protein